MNTKPLIISLAIALSSHSAAANTDTAEQSAQFAKLNAASNAVEVRRHMRLRKFELAEFSDALRQRQPSTYRLFKDLSQNQQQTILEAFNAGTNATQLKALIQKL